MPDSANAQHGTGRSVSDFPRANQAPRANIPRSILPNGAVAPKANISGKGKPAAVPNVDRSQEYGAPAPALERVPKP